MIAEHTGFTDHSQAALGSRRGADRRRGDPRRRRGSAACGTCRRHAGRRDGRLGGRPAARHPLPELREADPGASARACPAGSGRRRDRNRLRVASRAPGAARRGAQPAREGARRPRTTSSAGRSRRGSSTTARESTRACSRSVAPWSGRPRAIGCPEHPCQQALRDEIARAAEVDPESMPTAADGCGIPTFALHARADGTRLLEARPARRTLRGSSPRCAPIQISCAGRRRPTPCSCGRNPAGLRREAPKGLLCAVSADGLGVALKIEDGSQRAIRPAAAKFLSSLGVDTGELGHLLVENSRGEVVGELRAI